MEKEVSVENVRIRRIENMTLITKKKRNNIRIVIRKKFVSVVLFIIKRIRKN